MFFFIINLIDFELPTSQLCICLSFLDLSHQWQPHILQGYLRNPKGWVLNMKILRRGNWTTSLQLRFSADFSAIFVFTATWCHCWSTSKILDPGNCPLLLSCSSDDEIQMLTLLWDCPCTLLNHLGGLTMDPTNIGCLVCLSPHVWEWSWRLCGAHTSSNSLEQSWYQDHGKGKWSQAMRVSSRAERKESGEGSPGCSLSLPHPVHAKGCSLC